MGHHFSDLLYLQTGAPISIKLTKTLMWRMVSPHFEQNSKKLWKNSGGGYSHTTDRIGSKSSSVEPHKFMHTMIQQDLNRHRNNHQEFLQCLHFLQFIIFYISQFLQICLLNGCAKAIRVHIKKYYCSVFLLLLFCCCCFKLT